MEGGPDAADQPDRLQVPAESDESGQNDDDDRSGSKRQRQTVAIGRRCGDSRAGGQRLLAGRLLRLLPVGDDRGSSDGHAERTVVQRGR